MMGDNANKKKPLPRERLNKYLIKNEKIMLNEIIIARKAQERSKENNHSEEMKKQFMLPEG